MIKYCIVLIIMLIAGVTLFCVSECHAQDYTTHQQMVIAKVTLEAHRQSVPLEFVLANVDIESEFKDRTNPWRTAFGPLQVHQNALFPSERKDLPRLDWNIAKGVKILGALLKKAKGKTLHARQMYVCGPKPGKTCSSATLERIQDKWTEAVARWKIPVRYGV